MRSTPRIVLALLMTAPALAGCVSNAPIANDLDEGGASASTLPDITVSGTEPGESSDSSMTFVWNGAVSPGSFVPVLGVMSVRGSETLDVPAPAGVLFALNVTLTWETNDDLDLLVRSGEGAMKCASAMGGGPTGDDGEEQCEARLLKPLDADETWRISVVPYSNLQSDLPFTVVLRYDLVQAPPLLGPAIPALPEGATPRLAFEPAVLVDKDMNSAEPSIALDSEDTIYYAAPTGAQGSLWRSKDGLAFERVPIAGLPPFPIGGGDSDIVVEGTDHLYFADLTGLCNTVSSSHDGGQSWFNQPLSCDAPLVDRQWLAADGADTVWLAFNGRLGATVVKSIDGGKTFPIRAYPPEGGFCARGNIEFSKADGMLYLAGCNRQGPGVGVSSDGGLTWTWTTVAERSGEPRGGFCHTCNIFSVVDTDEKGNVYVVWSDPSGGDGLDVWFAASTDQGKTFGEAVKVNHATGTHLLPWVAAGPEGRAVVVWYGTRYVGDPNEAEGEWYAHAAVTEDATAAAPAFDETLISPEPIQFGPVCTRGSGCAGGRNLLDFFEVALDSSGNPHVAYVDGRAGGTARNALLMYARADLA